MSRHGEKDWAERVAIFARSPRRVVSLDLLRRVEPKPDPKPEPTTDPDKKEHTTS